ncbi:MAG TPA: hypothetical protein PK869_12645, partial [Candidatus Hydrogenedentes bacterium]|nr:hypothetical protein [Candidatus Hydrogenedentota bacterium]
MRKIVVSSIVIIALAVSGGVWSDNARAASSVANDFEPFAVGWGVASTKAKAADKAEAKCVQNGGDPGVEAFTAVNGPGWSAVYRADDNSYVSHSYRYSKKGKAKRRGKEFCESNSGRPCILVKAF